MCETKVMASSTPGFRPSRLRAVWTGFKIARVDSVGRVQPGPPPPASGSVPLCHANDLAPAQIDSRRGNNVFAIQPLGRISTPVRLRTANSTRF